MKNNKGFSLVELIIVIAIMAILVGVLAPNLIKQLEKAKVSSDLEVCDAVVTALTTAETDLATSGLSEDNPFTPGGAAATDVTGTNFKKFFFEALGVSTMADVNKSLKSSGAKSITMAMTSDMQYKAWISGTDSTGSKKVTTNTISVN